MSRQQRDEIQKVLSEMREEYWRSLEGGEDAAAVATGDYLVFRLGGERYGFATALAGEVLRIPRLVRVPRVAPHIRGVINLRGQVLAVTDLRPVLGLPGGDIPASGRLVVVRAAGLETALVTEGVEGIVSLPLEEIEAPTEGLAGFPRELLEGQIHDGGGLLMLLDLERILARPEFVIDQKGS